jgi:hypothetical protein
MLNIIDWKWSSTYEMVVYGNFELGRFPQVTAGRLVRKRTVTGPQAISGEGADHAIAA